MPEFDVDEFLAALDCGKMRHYVVQDAIMASDLTEGSIIMHYEHPYVRTGMTERLSMPLPEETEEQAQRRVARQREEQRKALTAELARLEREEDLERRIEKLVDLGPPPGNFLTWERQYEDGGTTYTYAAVRVDREERRRVKGVTEVQYEDVAVPYFYVTGSFDTSKGVTYRDLVEKYLVHAEPGSIKRLSRGKRHTDHNAVNE